MIWAPSWLANSSAAIGAGLVEQHLVVLAHPLVLRRRGRLGRRWGRLTGRSWSRLLGRPLDGLLAGLRGAAVDGGPDLQVGTDYLDQAVTQHVDAAAPWKRSRVPWLVNPSSNSLPRTSTMWAFWLSSAWGEPLA